MISKYDIYRVNFHMFTITNIKTVCKLDIDEIINVILEQEDSSISKDDINCNFRDIEYIRHCYNNDSYNEVQVLLDSLDKKLNKQILWISLIDESDDYLIIKIQ